MADKLIKYFESSKVKVFPSSYRAADKDPAARLNTEYNFIHKGIVDGINDSYIIEYTSGILKCVVSGYYFEITTDSTDFISDNKQFGLCVKTKELNIGSSTNKTAVLCNYADSTTTLDVEDQSIWYFKGLALVEDTGLFIFKKVDDNIQLCIENKLPLIQHGTGENSVRLGNDTEAAGDNSLASGNESKAKAKNTVAFGDHAIADKENLVAIGKYNTTEENDLFVIGKGTGDETRTNALQVNSNKVIISESTTINGDETLSGNLVINTNKFKVSATDGKVEVAGDLEIASNKFKVDATNGNTEVAGTLGITGATTVTNDTEASKSGQETAGALRVSGGVYVAKNLIVDGTAKINDKLTIADSTTISSDLTVSGNTTISGELTVGSSTNNKETTLNGMLIVNGTGNSSLTFENGTLENTGLIKGNSLSAGSTTINSDGIESNKITVTGGNVLVDSNGNFEAKKLVTLGADQDDVIGNKARSAIKIGKTDATTEICGNLKASAGTVTLPNDLTKILFGTAELKTLLLNSLYPVGSVYTSFNADADTTTQAKVCPIANTLGGTWERIEGRFLWAAEDGDTVGQTDGSKNAILLTHTHMVWNNNEYTELQSSQAGIHNHTSEENGEHTHSFTATTYVHDATAGSSSNAYIRAAKEYGEASKATEGITIASAKSHTHTINDNTATHSHNTSIPFAWRGKDDTAVSVEQVTADSSKITQLDGVGANMPPYIAVYMWRRTL